MDLGTRRHRIRRLLGRAAVTPAEKIYEHQALPDATGEGLLEALRRCVSSDRADVNWLLRMKMSPEITPIRVTMMMRTQSLKKK